MPIKGLTDRESVQPRFTRLGKIRKGEKRGGNVVDLDYFRFVGEGQHRAELEEVWRMAYGEQPVMVFLYLPHRSMEENWSTWREAWTEKQGLQHRCDGEYCVRWLDTKTMTYISDPRQEQRKQCPGGCKEVGRLDVILPPFLEAGFPGYVTLEIHSVNDLANITASLLDAEGKARSAGRPNGLQGIEFVLTRRPEKIGVRFVGKTGGVTKTTAQKWMLRLDPSREWLQAQLETTQQMALGRTVDAPPVVELPALTVEYQDDEVDDYRPVQEQPAQSPARSPFGAQFDADLARSGLEVPEPGEGVDAAEFWGLVRKAVGPVLSGARALDAAQNWLDEQMTALALRAAQAAEHA